MTDYHLIGYHIMKSDENFGYCHRISSLGQIDNRIFVVVVFRVMLFYFEVKVPSTWLRFVVVGFGRNTDVSFWPVG